MPSHQLKLSKLDADERVIADLLCIECGAELITHHISERCPQCNHPVSDSVHGDFLIHADRAHVRRIADATRAVKIAGMFLGGIIVLGCIATLFSSANFNDGLLRSFMLLLVGAAIAPILATLGVFTVTTRHAPAYYRALYARPGALRKPLIILALLIVAVSVGLWFAFPIVSNLLMALWIIVPAAVFLRRLSALMARIPNRQLSDFARMLYFATFPCGAFLYTAQLITAYAAPEEDGWRDGMLAAQLVSVMIGIGVSIASVRLLTRAEEALFKASH